MRILQRWFPIIIAFAFFVVGVITLPHYGINWDTINHLPRGQAYLHYFLTGKKDYSDLVKWESYYQNPDSLFIDANKDLGKRENRRSFYQSDATTFNWFMENDGGGHPPISDILSSVFNRVLFGYLGVINDVDSYRVYGIFLAAVLIYLIFVWVRAELGVWPAVASAFILASYPLFWAEAHFNTEKDIPETVFWSLLMYFVYKGIRKKEIKKILLAGVFFGFALGTKFNVVFSALILIPLVCMSFVVDMRNKKNKRKIVGWYLRLCLAGIVAGVIGLVIFIGFWPYLWPDVLGRTLEVVSFYKNIGLSLGFDSRYLTFLGINTFPVKHIFYSTFPVVVGLTLIGIFVAIYRVKTRKDMFAFLVLLWFMIPIVRASMPGASIYGGIRQIMEYIPAMAILAGYGVDGLMKIIKQKFNLQRVVAVVVVVMFGISITKLIKIHPYENVYFNFFMGGLGGAKERDFPYWGNTFGSAYRGAFSFVNKDAKHGERVVFVYELMANFPRFMVRNDLLFWNANRSGYLREGEYAVTLNYDGVEGRSYYDKYLNQFLNPIYEEMVDGVPVVRVWKNSDEYLKEPWIEKEILGVKIEKKKGVIMVDLGEIVPLVRMEMDFLEGQDCVYPKAINFDISRDGKDWGRMPENLPNDWLIPLVGQQPDDGRFIHPFAGEKIRYVKISFLPVNACIANYSRLLWFQLE